MSTVIGTASVLITPNTAGFAGALSGQMSGALSGINSQVNGVSATFDGMAKRADALAGSLSSTGSKLTRNLTLPLVGLGYAAINVSSDFDNALRTFAAVAEIPVDFSDQTSEINKMREAALALGRDGKFSAVEVADGFAELARAGVKSNDVVSTSVPIMNLATIENLEFGKAAEGAINVTLGFGKQLSEMTGVIDVLAVTANKSTSSMTELTDAFRYAGPLASAVGQTFEETAAALGIMANAGFKGSLGGTALRGAIARLAVPSTRASEDLEKLGFSVEKVVKETESVDLSEVKSNLEGLGLKAGEVDAAMKGFDGSADASKKTIQTLGVQVFDAAGKMLPLSDVLIQMKERGITAGQAMTVFGLRAGPGMLALLNQGPEKIQELAATLGDAGGAADEMAKKILEGPTYSFNRLKNAAIELGISIGNSGLLQVLGDIALKATDLLHGLSEANPEMLRTATMIAAVAAAIGPAFKLLSFFVSGWAQLFKILAFITSGPLGVIVALIAAVGGALYLAWTFSEPFRASVTQLWSVLKDLFEPVIESVKAKVEGLAGVFATIGKFIGDNLAPYIQDLTRYIQYLRKEFADVSDDDGPAIVGIFRAIQGAAEQVIGALSPFFDAIRYGFEVARGNGDGFLHLMSDMGAASELGPIAEGFVKFGAQVGAAFGQILNFISALRDFGPNSAETDGVIATLREHWGMFGRVIGGVMDTLDSLMKFVQSVVWPILQGLAQFVVDFVVPAFAVALVVAIEAVLQVFDRLGGVIDVLTAILTPVANFIKDNMTPIMLALGAALATLALGPVFAGIAGAAGTLGAALAAVSSVVSGLVFAFQAAGIVGVLQTAFTGLAAAAGTILSPIALVAIAIAAVVALLVIVYQRSEDFRVAVSEGWNAIMETVNGVVMVFQGLWDVLAGIFTLDGSRILDGLATALDGLVRGVLGGLANLGSALAEGLRAIVATVFDALSNIPVIGPVFQVIGDTVQGLINVLKGLFDILAGIFTFDWDKIKDGAATAFGGLWEAIKTLPEGIINLLAAIGPQIGPALGALGSFLIDWFSQSLPPLLVQGLTLALQGLDILATLFLEYGGKIIKWLLDGATAGIQYAVDFFKQLPTFLVNAVVGFFTGGDNGPGGGLGTTIGGWLETAISAALGFLINVIPGLTFKLLDILWTVFKFVFLELPGRIITQGIPALVGAIIEFGPAILTALADLPVQLGNFLWTAIQAIGPLLLRAVTAFPEIFLDWLSQLWDLIGPFFLSLPGRIGDALIGLAGILWNALVSAVLALPDLIGGAINGLIQIFIGIPLQIVSGLLSLGQIIKDNVFLPAFNWLVENLPGIISGVIEFFMSLPGRIVDAIGNLGAWIHDHVMIPMGLWLIQNGPGVIQGIIDFFTSLPSKIVDAIGNLGAWIHDHVMVPMGLWIIENGPTVVQGIVDFFTSLPGKIVDGIGNLGTWLWDHVFIPAGTWIVQNFPGWIDNIVNFFKEIPGKILDALSSLAGGVWDTFVNVGKSILEGIGSGLGAAGDWIGNFAKNVGNAIIDWVNLHIISGINTAIPDNIGPFDVDDNPIPNIPQIGHTGGIVGSLPNAPGRALRPDETLAVLQNGEGILPLSVMNSLGANQFEMLRQGMVPINQAATSTVRGPSAGRLVSPTTGTVAGGGQGDINVQVIVNVDQNTDAAHAERMGSVAGAAAAREIEIRQAIWAG